MSRRKKHHPYTGTATRQQIQAKQQDQKKNYKLYLTYQNLRILISLNNSTDIFTANGLNHIT